jgi:uncharacterized protein YjbI with pentapeptide repeats
MQLSFKSFFYTVFLILIILQGSEAAALTRGKVQEFLSKSRAETLNKGLALNLGYDYENLNLNGIDFSNVKIVNANFNGANLSEVDFSNSIFENCTFVGANLEGANFFNASIAASDFTNANLQEASFNNSFMNYSTFENAKLQNSIL